MSHYGSSWVISLHTIYQFKGIIGQEDSISWVKKSFDHSDRRANSLQLPYASSYNRIVSQFIYSVVI